ncbi:hypothetical protein LTR17_024595 [Elasticomyces elasticus]|nr:hypothetical protein LTR17_024595 [Elasticomyces elasticus]
MAATNPGSEAEPATVMPENNTTLQDITIAEEGDIILVLEDGKKRIKVLAAILSFKSKVFKKMLGPHFLEGQTQRSSEQPQEIQLPEDDADAMVLMCQLLHSGGPGKERGHLREVAVMASLADKYDCVYEVSFISETLLKRWAAAGGITYCRSLDWAPFATTTLLLGLNHMFVQVTRHTVLGVSSSFSQMRNSDCVPLPITVLLGLEEQRAAARNLLVDKMATRTAGGTCQVGGCNGVPSMSTFERDIAHRLGSPHWPPVWDLQPLRGIFQKLASQPDILVSHTFKCGHSNPPVVLNRVGLQAVVREVKESAYGMCPWCARQDKLQSRCEHVHKLKKVPHGDPLRQLDGTTT